MQNKLYTNILRIIKGEGVVERDRENENHTKDSAREGDTKSNIGKATYCETKT